MPKRPPPGAAAQARIACQVPGETHRTRSPGGKWRPSRSQEVAVEQTFSAEGPDGRMPQPHSWPCQVWGNGAAVFVAPPRHAVPTLLVPFRFCPSKDSIAGGLVAVKRSSTNGVQERFRGVGPSPIAASEARPSRWQAATKPRCGSPPVWARRSPVAPPSRRLNAAPTRRLRLEASGCGTPTFGRRGRRRYACDGGLYGLRSRGPTMDCYRQRPRPRGGGESAQADLVAAGP